MPTTKYILEQIKIEGALKELLVKSNAENVAVTYNGAETTLAAALASIYQSITNLPTAEGVDSKISAALGSLVNGAPEAGDTLKELFDLISSNTEAMALLNAAIGGKVDKVEGKGLSTEDFTTALKNKLDAMEGVTAEEKAAWNDKADKTKASATADGLMSKEDKARLDGLRGVRYGATPPDDMQDGELFVRVVSQ